MGRRITVLLCAASVAVACGGSGDDDERLMLVARDREFSNSVKDMDKVLAFYLPDASLYLPGLPAASGPDNIRAAAQKFGSVPGFTIEWEPEEAGVSGGLGYVAGSYRMTTETANQPHAVKGRYVEVWKKAGGEWKIAEHVFHPNPE
jgi:ketosteroid isomerase-like protein